MITGSRDERRDDIAIPITERHDLIAFDFLVSATADVVTAFFRGRRRAIAVDDGHVEPVGLMEPHYHGGENNIETAASLHRRKAP